MIHIFVSRQFILFLITGGVAALVNFGSRFVFSEYVEFGTAVILAYLVGMITAYLLAKVIVFKGSSNSVSKSFFWFSIINILAIVQTYFVSIGLAYHLFPLLDFSIYPESIAHAIGIIVPVFSSFFGHKYLSFRGAT